MNDPEKEVWTEEHPGPNEPVTNAIFAILIKLGPHDFEAIGTGFVIGMTKFNEAVAMSAAHVFDEIYKKFNPTTPRPSNPLIREKAQKIDLDVSKVFGLLFWEGRSHILQISSLIYDHGSDAAIFQVRKNKPDSRPIFKHNLRLDADLPSVGENIEGIGFKHMKIHVETIGDLSRTILQASLTRRIGTVTEVLERASKLQGPGVRASFPIFGGMSGGPALRVMTGNAPAAFGLLSSDMNDSIVEKYDKRILGTTTIAKLPLRWQYDAHGNRDAIFQSLADDEGTGE